MFSWLVIAVLMLPVVVVPLKEFTFIPLVAAVFPVVMTPAINFNQILFAKS